MQKTRIVQELGDSLAITIPAHICEALKIKKGDIIHVELEDKRIILLKVNLAEAAT